MSESGCVKEQLGSLDLVYKSSPVVQEQTCGRSADLTFLAELFDPCRVGEIVCGPVGGCGTHGYSRCSASRSINAGFHGSMRLTGGAESVRSYCQGHEAFPVMWQSGSLKPGGALESEDAVKSTNRQDCLSHSAGRRTGPESSVTLHASRITHPTSRITHPTSCITHPTSCFTHHAAYLNNR